MKKYQVLYWNTEKKSGAGSQSERYTEVVEARTLEAATTKAMRKALKAARVLRWNAEAVKYMVAEA